MRPPTVRRILFAAAAALTVGVGALSLVVGFSESFPVRLLQGLFVLAMGAVILFGTVAFLTTRLGGWRSPASELEFDRIVERAERLAAEDRWGEADDDLEGEDDEEDWIDLHDEEDFRAVVRSALDELPLEFHRALEHVAVVISDGGRRRRAYGLYQGGTVANDGFHHRILIFRDTLVRDFGHDHEALKAQVVRTVRHELAHHLGWDEKGVRGLGL
jgi:predicted Zn-dependent protease with MMP-like domain